MSDATESGIAIRATKLVQVMATASCLLMGFMTGFIEYAKPCVALLMGYLLLSWGGICHYSPCSWPSCIVRALIVPFDTYIWYSIFAGGPLLVFCGVLVHSQCLVQYLIYAGRILSGKKSSRQNQDGFLIYRQIQLLAVVFNETYQT